jgi:putative ABC transport system permease protein
MLRIALKGVRGHLTRFLLTLVAVTLGVSFVAGTLVLTDSINATFDDLITQATKGTDAQVRGVEGGDLGDGGGAVRAPLPIDLVEKIRAVDGVKRAVPDYQGNAIVVGKDNTAVRSGGAPTFGFAILDGDPTLKLVSGRAPVGPNEVALESKTLELSKLKVGDRTRAVLGTKPVQVTITGDYEFGAALAGSTIVLVDEPTAKQFFAPDGTVAQFAVTAEPGVSQQQLVDRLKPVLPADAQAVTGQVVTEEFKKGIKVFLDIISIFFLVFAAVAVFVGIFIIFNTFSMLVAQRTRELGMLRAVGASRGQVLRVVLGEAVVIGLAGSVLGLGFGVAIAAGLKVLVAQIGLEIGSDLPILPATVIASLTVGILVTLFSAILPAVRASRITPVQALREDQSIPQKGLWVRGIIGTVAVALGAAAAAVGVTTDDANWGLLGIGAVLALVGVLMAAPVVTQPVVSLVTWPFVALTRVVGRMARLNAQRNPRRTAATASALTIGLALIAGISVIAESTKASVSDLVEQQLTADYVLNGGQSPFPESVAAAAAKLPGVQSVAAVNLLNVKTPKDTYSASAGTAEGIRDNIKMNVTSGSLDVLGSGQVLVEDGVAKANGWKVGSTFTGTVGALRDQPLAVGGTFEKNEVLGAGVIVPTALYEKAVPSAQRVDFLVYVKAKAGGDAAALRQALVKEVEPFVVVSVQDGSEFVSSQADQVNTLLGLLYGLLFLSVIIAVLGIINTLALSVFERTREIGLLRAVGLSRQQLRSMITIEAIATAVFGAVIGTGLGLGLGVAVRRAMVDQGINTLAIPWGLLIGVLAMAAVIGVIAALLPAWRAVRLDILRAVTTE